MCRRANKLTVSQDKQYDKLTARLVKMQNALDEEELRPVKDNLEMWKQAKQQG